jgi:phosphoribosylanthranilate isomerase
MHLKVKICGITTPDDAQAAIDAGADYLGLNFLAGPRRISLSTAATIAAAVPNPIKIVALTGTRPTHPDAPTLAAIIDALPRVHAFQLYGPPPFEQHDFHGGEYWIVAHLDPVAPDSQPHPKSPQAQGSQSLGLRAQISDRLDLLDFLPHALVADRKVGTQLGGTGQPLDWAALHTAWNALRRTRTLPKMVLAGGLNPGNVATAIRAAHPTIVDVSSGVERDGQPGRTDPEKMRAFIDAVRTAGT